jgi:hypothetical protein
VGTDRRVAAHRQRPRRALRGSPRGHGRQGDGRLHEPADLRRPLQGARRAAPRLARRERRQGRHQGRDDRVGVRPERLAAAHPQQAAPRGAGQAVQEPERPVQARHRPRHVAHGLRRAVHAHDVRRQADAGPRPHAGHRAREPRVPRQAGRPRGRLPGPRRPAQGALHTYTESGGRARRRSTRKRPWR